MLFSLVVGSLILRRSRAPPKSPPSCGRSRRTRAASRGSPPTTPSEKTRAVVLLPGLFVHPVRPAKASQPWRRDWQEPNSELVKALAPDFDVFAFSYAQTVRVDEVAHRPGLRDAIARLRKAGYKEIVLVGHSAGG